MTSQPLFNLLDEPWIPVRTHTGEVSEVSLTDALLKSNDYASLAETSPPNLIALYRLLLAALHRALTTQHGKWNDTDRARWFRDGLPEAPIRAYLAEWRERFWLFHLCEPFMQVAALAEADKTRDKLKPWSQIALELSGGDTPLVFDHSLDSAPQPSEYSRVLRSLIGYLQFTPGGLVKTFKTADFAGPLASTAAVMPVGASLSETLLLSLHPWSREAIDDLPSWEVLPVTLGRIMSPPSLPSGHNDRYTRLTRSVLFTLEDRPYLVRFIRFSEGCGIQDDYRDPMVSSRVKDGEAQRISFTEGRGIWRDLPTLVPDTTRTYDIQAPSLGWAINLFLCLGDYSGNLSIVAAGWKNAPNKAAKLVRWRLDRIELPPDLLLHADSAQFLRITIRDAEGLYFRLREVYVELVAQTMRDSKHKDTKARAKGIIANGPAAAVFFSAAERAVPRLMQQIAAGDTDMADHAWKAALVKAAKQSWTATRRSLGDSPTVLRADARTWPQFCGLLKALLPPSVQSIATRPDEAPT